MKQIKVRRGCYCFLCVLISSRGTDLQIWIYLIMKALSSTSVKGHITESTCPLVDGIQNCAGGHTSVKTSVEASHSLGRVFFKKKS